MKIKNIKITNFKSIEEYSMDFDSISGLWEITGPVGSGKTSFGEAILYGLYGSVKDKNIKDLIKWGEKKMCVCIELESKGHNIYIERSAGTGAKLNIIIDDIPFTYSSKVDAQKKLENEYYDVSKLSLETLCVISFQGFKSLATLTPTDSKKFLNSTFGLSVLTDLNEICSEYRSQSKTELSKINNSISDLNSQKKVYNEFMSNTEKFTEKDLKTFCELKERKLSEYKEIQQKCSNDQSGISSELFIIQKRLGEIKSKGSQIKKNIDFVSKGICPTCGGKLDQSNLCEYEEERKNLLDEYKELDERSNELLKEKRDIESSYNEQLRKISEEGTQIASKITQAKLYLEKEAKCVKDIDKIDRQLLDLNSDLTSEQCEYNEWDDLGKYLEKDSRHKIISNIIPTLNKKINEYITELECTYSIEFNDQFKCTIKSNILNIEVPISSLSTGQLKTVDMIIIMSILDILMNGVNFNIHFLDELFSNMDMELRGRMCDILKKKCNSNGIIFVISHANLPSESIDGTLSVSYKNGKSSFSTY